MTSKTKTTATTEEAKPALMPKLRFPEFRGAEGWNDKTLGQMGTFIRGLTYTPGDVADSGLLVLRSGNIQDGSLVFDKDLVFVEKECTPDLLLRVGDVVICMSNGSKALVGKSAEYRDGYSGEVTIGAFCSLFRPSNPFAKIAFRSEQYSDFIADSIMGGNINNLKNSTLEGFPFPVPPTKAEQQKIAECLSSVDELMAAQARKVDALKTHKKGLMQQLFPREGETQPRLRFPEFQNAGEWEEKRLEALAKRGSGHTPSKSHPEYYNGGIKWVSLADSKRLDNGLIFETAIEISEEGIQNSSAVLHPEGTVFISRDAGIGKSAVMSEPMAVSQHFIAWTCKPRVLSNWFLYHLLQDTKPQFERAATGSTIKTIGLQFFIDLAFRVPAFAEQQRVADCLNSLDKLINAETQKLEALKNHKKGLMQRLFPTPQDTE